MAFLARPVPATPIPPPPGASPFRESWDLGHFCDFFARQYLSASWGNDILGDTLQVPASEAAWTDLVAHYGARAGKPLDVPERFRRTCSLRGWAAGPGTGPVAVVSGDYLWGSPPSTRVFTVLTPAPRRWW